MFQYLPLYLSFTRWSSKSHYYLHAVAQQTKEMKKFSSKNSVSDLQADNFDLIQYLRYCFCHINTGELFVFKFISINGISIGILFYFLLVLGPIIGNRRVRGAIQRNFIGITICFIVLRWNAPKISIASYREKTQ